MLPGQPDLLNASKRLFHVSEEPRIRIFKPRPSPSPFADIKGDVVFAIAGNLLHNYLLPRDCPRVTYYAGTKTAKADKEKFIGSSAAEFFVCIESGWYQRVMETRLYCYEFLSDNFELIDESAGYYVSYQPAVPQSVIPVSDILSALLSRNIELRFMPSLVRLAEDVSKSTLNFSNIRMRNAALK
ncbi:DUF6886 family protein [Mucilaginibacter gotjawali]|uniref:Uncharacterized protein n=2 Tax=Mucilaginibacter gotjawali TaxID=1550579 RepID=A0A839SD47_9SPHI|nr:DUF6886 family protein [Mucilaginibacter gotjawali]MBB3055508.1 hypothetical protein [Mucilaginibacter gotjawali]BAU53213.1 hypothetical protein MgSA37_01380 [Mucilaginibacter gotjawali]